MDYQRKRIISLWTIFLCLTALIWPVNCGSITSFPTKQGLLDSPLNITCSYDLLQDEQLDSVVISRLKSGDADYQDIVKFSPSGSFFYTVAQDLNSRSTLSLENNVATIAISNLKCGDEGQYSCKLDFVAENGITGDSETMQDGLTVQGGPKKPSQLNQSPSDVAEYEAVSFTCVAEVGKSPVGGIQWEKVMPDNTQDIVTQGVSNVESETPNSCTKTITSTLVMNATRNDNGMKIRCSTTHPTSGLQDPNHYLDSNNLIVYYPVGETISVYQAPNNPTQTEGQRVMLKCNVKSVPAATYKWHHKESNVTFDADSNGEKVFPNIQLSDAGTYRCDAENTYQNKTFTTTRSILVQVDGVTTTDRSTINAKQTTPSPTEPSGSSSNLPGGVTEPNTGTAGNGDDETLIIIIVCVVIGLLIIAGIILFIICRKKRQEKIKSQKIETPSEKPYNNNPAINGYSSRQPDLVSDEKKLYTNQQLHPYNNPNSPYNNVPYDFNPNTSFDKRSEDFSSYGDINFDDRPRSRKPVALSDADYADISMPRV